MSDTVLPTALGDATVLVIGLGPVGSVAALSLALKGVRVVAVEAARGIVDDPAESRASTFHPPTLEMLERLGVCEDLHRTGIIADTFQYRDRREGIVAHFDLSCLAGDTTYPYRLQSEQSNLVHIIRQRLDAMDNVRIISAAATSVADHGGFVRVGVDQGASAGLIDASWVIAADGSNSIARRDLGIDFLGMTYEERFLVISTTTDLSALIPDIAGVNYVSDPDEWFVLLRTPRHWRAMFPVPDSEDPAVTLASAGIQGRLQLVAPFEPGYDVTHTTIYSVHQRVATTFHQGRLVLVGDAAHINNPLGGMGMNSGIHDAIAAAEAMVKAMGSDTEALEDYAIGRRRFALQYVQMATHRNYEIMQERDPAVRAGRLDELRRTASDPVLAREYLLKSSMLASVRSG